MGIARSIINWCDKTFADSLTEPDDRKGVQKACTSGFVEGLVDGALVMYIPLMIACCVYKSKLNKK